MFISDHRTALEKARSYTHTESFKQEMKLRPLVERFIANLVRYHGARQARARGKMRADFQAKMCALSFNLAQWVRLAASTSPSG